MVCKCVFVRLLLLLLLLLLPSHQFRFVHVCICIPSLLEKVTGFCFHLLFYLEYVVTGVDVGWLKSPN